MDKLMDELFIFFWIGVAIILTVVGLMVNSYLEFGCLRKVAEEFCSTNKYIGYDYIPTTSFGMKNFGCVSVDWKPITFAFPEEQYKKCVLWS